MSTGKHNNPGITKISKVHAFKFRDVIIDSVELKKLIKYRAKELNINFMALCRVNNVSYEAFKKYLINDKSLSTSSLRQEHLMNIAESIGIRIRVQIIIGKFEDIDKSRFE